MIEPSPTSLPTVAIDVILDLVVDDAARNANRGPIQKNVVETLRSAALISKGWLEPAQRRLFEVRKVDGGKPGLRELRRVLNRAERYPHLAGLSQVISVDFGVGDGDVALKKKEREDEGYLEYGDFVAVLKAFPNVTEMHLHQPSLNRVHSQCPTDLASLSRVRKLVVHNGRNDLDSSFVHSMLPFVPNLDSLAITQSQCGYDSFPHISFPPCHLYLRSFTLHGRGYPKERLLGLLPLATWRQITNLDINTRDESVDGAYSEYTTELLKLVGPSLESLKIGTSLKSWSASLAASSALRSVEISVGHGKDIIPALQGCPSSVCKVIFSGAQWIKVVLWALVQYEKNGGDKFDFEEFVLDDTTKLEPQDWKEYAYRRILLDEAQVLTEICRKLGVKKITWMDAEPQCPRGFRI